jgi:hypothetical protein
MRVCDRSQLDLPLADLVETELFKFVEERREREEKAAAAAAATAAATIAAATAPVPSDGNGTPIDADAHIFPRSLSSSRPVRDAFQGHWLVHSYSQPSGLSADVRTPPLLHLTPALGTRSKMDAYRQLQREEQEAEARRLNSASAAAGAPAAAAAAVAHDSGSAAAAAAPPTSSAAVVAPSLSLSLSSSSVVSVVVPHSVLELLSESSDGGVGWQFNLEITRYHEPLTSLQLRGERPGAAARDSDKYFDITKAGHVNCA